MKKFSKITGEKISEAPKLKEKVLNPEDLLRYEIYSIMDSHLKVQFLGSIDATLGGSMKVAGKEPFVEALINLFQSKSSKDKIKMLESLKSETTDWQLIDSKMDQLEEEYLNEEKISLLKSPKEKLKDIYTRYKDDEDLLLKKLDKAILRMKNGKAAFYRHLAAEEMSKPGSGFPNSTFKEISGKYLLRSKQLGYNR